MENTDILIAAYYTNHSEMVDRRVALGSDSRGNLPISCGAPSVWRSYNVTENFGPVEQTAMLAHRCTLNDGVTPRSAFNRISALAENYAAAGAHGATSSRPQATDGIAYPFSELGHGDVVIKEGVG